MELFEVFIKIAINAEEISRKLDKIMRALKKFADTCKEVADKCSSMFERMRDGFMEFATTLGAINTYIKFGEYLHKGFTKLKENAERIVTTFQNFGTSIGNAVTYLKDLGERAIETGVDIYNYLSGKLKDAVNWLTKLGEDAKKTGMRIYNYLTTKLTEAVNWLTKLGTSAIDAGKKFITYLGDKLVLVGKKVAALGVKVKALAGKLLLLLGPKGLIVAAIAAVVGAVIVWLKNNEEAQEKLAKVWDKIKKVFDVVLGFIKDIVGRVFGWVQGFIDDHGKTITKIFSVVWDTVRDIFDRVVYNIQSIFRVFTAIFQGDWQTAWNEVLAIGSRFMYSIENTLSGIVNIGRNLIYGLWNGIQSMKQWITNKITGFFNSGILGAVTSFLGINSPSTLFADKVGKGIVKGLAKGIDDEAYVAKDSAIKMAQEMLEPQVEMFELSFLEISAIVIRTLDNMSRKAIQVIRAMTAKMDAILNSDGFRIGRNFFRALGDGLIAEESALLSRASWVADAIRAAFANPFGNPAWAAVNAANSWGANHSGFDVASMPMAASNVNITQNFYGVREKETAYQAYRAAQRVAWGVER